MVQCYRCNKVFSPGLDELKQWAESGNPFDPTDWLCDDCHRTEQSPPGDDEFFVADDLPCKCPKCGEMNAESPYEAYHYECSCGCSYDFCVCDHCEAEIGMRFGDSGICAACGQPYTG